MFCHRSIFSILSPLTLLCALVALTVPAFAGPGDLDGDGAVTFRDAAQAARIASGLDPAPDDALLTGDVASVAGKVRDQQITLFDALLIARAAGGLEPLDSAHGPADGLSYIQRTITISNDVTIDAQFEPMNLVVPWGNLVTGTVTEQPGAGIRGVLWFYQFTTGGGASGSGVGLDEQGSYRTQLATGEYNLYYGNTVTESAEGGVYQWPYIVSLNQTVSVSGPKVLDVAGGTSPVPGILAGSIETSSLIPTRISVRPARMGVLLPTEDPKGIASNSAFRIKAVPGDYRVSEIQGHLNEEPGITFGLILYNRPTATIAAGETTRQDFTLPSAVPVSFQMTPPDGATVTKLMLSGQILSTKDWYSATYTVPEGSRAYRSAAPPGTYKLYVSMVMTDPLVYRRTMRYILPVTIPGAGGNVPVAFPSMPVMATVSGRITYPNGLPAAGAFVSLAHWVDTTLRYLTDVMVLTDSDGKYTVQVPVSDYNYEFIVGSPKPLR